MDDDAVVVLGETLPRHRGVAWPVLNARRQGQVRPSSAAQPHRRKSKSKRKQTRKVKKKKKQPRKEANNATQPLPVRTFRFNVLSHGGGADVAAVFRSGQGVGAMVESSRTAKAKGRVKAVRRPSSRAPSSRPVSRAERLLERAAQREETRRPQTAPFRRGRPKSASAARPVRAKQAVSSETMKTFDPESRQWLLQRVLGDKQSMEQREPLPPPAMGSGLVDAEEVLSTGRAHTVRDALTLKRWLAEQLHDEIEGGMKRLREANSSADAVAELRGTIQPAFSMMVSEIVRQLKPHSSYHGELVSTVFREYAARMEQVVGAVHERGLEVARSCEAELDRMRENREAEVEALKAQIDLLRPVIEAERQEQELVRQRNEAGSASTVEDERYFEAQRAMAANAAKFEELLAKSEERFQRLKSDCEDALARHMETSVPRMSFERVVRRLQAKLEQKEQRIVTLEGENAQLSQELEFLHEKLNPGSISRRQ